MSLELEGKRYIAFWGYPDPEVIKNLKITYPQLEWLDLDIDFNAPDLNLLPDVSCKIIKNLINNAFFYRDKIFKIVAAIGKEKCDSGWIAATLLEKYGFDVIQTRYENIKNPKQLVYSTSNLPLFDKVNVIMNSIPSPIKVDCEYVQPKFGFWGVPPNDIDILKLFPDETHLYGWVRCCEAGVPADIEMEMFVDENVPTVFYSQAFCAKGQLAKYLANKYSGLYIDIDDYSTNSIKAKIEAFLRLR